MAVPDNKAKKLTLNFPGGYLTATRGLLEAMFDDLEALIPDAEPVTVSVKGHTRTRVIGGVSKTIAPNTYTLQKYPATVAGGPAGGEPIMVNLGEDWWTARLGGSHQAFAAFLSDGKAATNLFWKSEKGTNYGPF